VEATPEPFRLTPPEVTPPKKSKVPVAQRPDTIPADGTPARALYDAFVQADAVRAIVDRPGVFALKCMGGKYRTVPIEMLVRQVHSTDLYLASAKRRKPVIITGGWRFMEVQLDMAANDFVNSPVTAPAPTTASTPRHDGRHATQAGPRTLVDATPSPAHPMGQRRARDPLQEMYGTR